MNYYSADIINSIIDYTETEEIIDTIDQFYYDIKLLMFYYCRRDIHHNYIKRLVEDRTVQYAFRCIDTCEFRITNVPSLMAYVCNNTVAGDVYYILLICTKHQFKNMGYASYLLEDFIAKLREKKEKKGKHSKIVLSSLDSAATFYEKIGFHWTRKSLIEYDVLLQYEVFEKDKEYIIMEMDI